MPAPACPLAASPPCTPSLGRRRARWGGGVRGATPHDPRPFLPQPGVPLRCPRSRPRRRLRIRDFTSGKGKRERKVCRALAGEPARRTAGGSPSPLADASCLSAGLPAPCPARPPLPSPGPGPAAAAAAASLARVTTRPPVSRRGRSAAQPAPGAHTHSRWLARTRTHARTPPRAPRRPPLAPGVGGGGERGGGGRGRRAGRRPITSASSRPLGSQVFTPGKKKVQGKRPGMRTERGRPRVGTREPEKEKQRQRESEESARGNPGEEAGPARTPRREEGPAGDRDGQPRSGPRCPGSLAGFRQPLSPGSAQAGVGEGTGCSLQVPSQHICVCFLCCAEVGPASNPAFWPWWHRVQLRAPVGKQPGVMRERRM